MSAPDLTPLASTEQPLEQAPTALTPVDYFRGLAILEVVLHHSSGAARDYAADGSAALLFLTVLNRVLHFAVPGFLFLSAAVLTRSLLKSPNFGRYFWRRVVRGAWPYLLWTVLYLLWSAWLGDRPWDDLLKPEKWQLWLGYGKGNYHLYFLLVALESYVVLPFLLPLARGRLRISAALGLGLAVQIGIYWLNKYALHLLYPASTVLWYLAPVILGTAVGARWNEFQDWWTLRRSRVLLFTAAALALHLPLALAFLDGARINPWLYSASGWAYTTPMALVVLGAGYSLWQRGRLKWVGVLGGFSLQIYLIHPAILEGLESLLPTEGVAGLGAAPALPMFALMVLVSLALPFGMAKLLARLKLSGLFFGR
ncbi:acyltransferase [Deinococcus psychrotolerans]|uniref:Acyltransferase n=1 Tax=Deinococcus psychrotolerans TaxID=2489213 RepID=A0A3G8YF49_9DEIO|nr:acyltransferase [Deinococcus psychrotolerans]AZI43510.1 acyltransferase [Deinococcus psychrotolerans]